MTNRIGFRACARMVSFVRSDQRNFCLRHFYLRHFYRCRRENCWNVSDSAHYLMLKSVVMRRAGVVPLRLILHNAVPIAMPFLLAQRKPAG